jgi:hypothetical protein
MVFYIIENLTEICFTSAWQHVLKQAINLENYENFFNVSTNQFNGFLRLRTQSRCAPRVSVRQIIQTIH